MAEILDEPIKEFKENKYTELAYEKCKTATIFFVLGILIGMLIDMMYIPSDIVGGIPAIFFILSSIYGGLGFAKSLKSIQYKEEDTMKKWLSCALNIIYLLIILSMVLRALLHE